MRIACCLLLILASACTPRGSDERSRYTFASGEGRILARDWYKPDLQVKQEPVYCYSTLGRTDCHAVPIPEPNRLKGYYGPTPVPLPLVEPDTLPPPVVLRPGPAPS